MDLLTALALLADDPGHREAGIVLDAELRRIARVFPAACDADRADWAQEVATSLLRRDETLRILSRTTVGRASGYLYRCLHNYRESERLKAERQRRLLSELPHATRQAPGLDARVRVQQAQDWLRLAAEDLVRRRGRHGEALRDDLRALIGITRGDTSMDALIARVGPRSARDRNREQDRLHQRFGRARTALQGRIDALETEGVLSSDQAEEARALLALLQLGS